jgi:hypothetical protein
LSSRFDKILKFEDYTAEELLQIAMLMLAENHLLPTPEAEAHLSKYLEFIYDYRDKYFGNARTVRVIITEAIKNQNLRLAALTAEEREVTPINVLTLEDVETFKLDKSSFVFNKQGIGFRSKG